MKKLKNILAALLCCAALVSCEKADTIGSIGSVTFRGMDLGGATALALVNGGSQSLWVTRAVYNENSTNFIYKVLSNGALSDIRFTIDVSGDGSAVNLVRSNLTLKCQNIFSIGDDWLWLACCEFYYPGYEKMSDHKMHGAISAALVSAARDFPGVINFLVRKSDGAMFPWTEGVPLSGVMTKYSQDAISGKAEQIGRNIFTAIEDGHNGAGIYRITPAGYTLEVLKLTPSYLGAKAVLPTDGTKNYVGGLVSSNRPGYYDPQLVFTDGGIGSIAESEDAKISYGMEMFSIDNSLYIVNEEDMYATYKDGEESRSGKTQYVLHSVSAMEMPGMQGVKFGVLGDAICTLDAPLNPGRNVIKGRTVYWLSEGNLHFFSLDTKKVQIKTLPAHYPIKLNEYIDNVAYVLDPDETRFYICDLAKSEAEEVPIVVSADLIQYFINIDSSTMSKAVYEPSSQTFRSSGILNDGCPVTFYYSVYGPDRGVMKVLMGGDSDAGVNISVMVRL